MKSRGDCAVIGGTNTPTDRRFMERWVLFGGFKWEKQRATVKE